MGINNSCKYCSKKKEWRAGKTVPESGTIKQLEFYLPVIARFQSPFYDRAQLIIPDHFVKYDPYSSGANDSPYLPELAVFLKKQNDR